MGPEEASNDNDSGTDSDGDDDSIPELEETAGDAAGDPTAAGAVGTGGDEASKAKQRRGEKKARQRLRTCPSKPRWRLPRSSRLLRHLSQLRWELEAPLVLLPSLRRTKTMEMPLTRLVWKTRILSWSCPKPMCPAPRLSKH